MKAVHISTVSLYELTKTSPDPYLLRRRPKSQPSDKGKNMTRTYKAINATFIVSMMLLNVISFSKCHTMLKNEVLYIPL